MACERHSWKATQCTSSNHAHAHAPQLVSVISLLSADVPNLDSPANVDAAKQVREDFPAYKKKVRRLVRQSAEEAFD